MVILIRGSVCFCEWVRIDPSSFREKGDAARAFNDASFDGDYLYLITSDSIDRADPNRGTCLWASRIEDDPNRWATESQKMWAESGAFKGKGARMDRLFTGSGSVYAGIYDGGQCRVYKLLDPNQEVQVNIGSNTGQLAKWRVDCGNSFGNNLYIGIGERDYGCRIVWGDLASGQITQVIEDKDMLLGDPNLLSVSFLEPFGDLLYLGTRQTGRGAPLYYYNLKAKFWDALDKVAFFDSSGSSANEVDDISAYISMTAYMGKTWLLTESIIGSEKGWCIWESRQTSSDIFEWGKRFSSNDPNGPFSDSNIVSIYPPQVMGEYLYLTVISGEGGKVWKNYRGNEWISVPSSPFDPNNRIMAVFKNPADGDLIFAGTVNDSGAQILTRLVPRIDISGLSMKDRFIPDRKEEKPQIKFFLKPNWEGESHWLDPNNVPSASIVSLQAMDGGYVGFDNPNQVDPNGVCFWDFGLKMNREGVYTVEWELIYGNGEDSERVIKQIALAFDANAPSAPGGLDIGVGDGRIIVSWQASTDNFEKGTAFEDANFRESLDFYELEYWRGDDPNQSLNAQKQYIVAGYSAEGTPSAEIQNLQNHIAYKIRVRARDKAGNISGWSDEVEGTPSPTLGLTDLVNEKGGCFISFLDSGRNEDTPAKRRWFSGVKAGFYGPQADATRQVYGEDRGWPVQLEIGWVHRPYMEIGLAAGYMEMDGMALLPDGMGKSIDHVVFRMVPCSMTLRFIPFRNIGRVLSPYIGGGPSIWWYQEDKLDKKDIDGCKYGYHGVLGLRVLLDQLDPKHARLMSENYWVLDTYFTLEAVYNWIDNYGDSQLDLGGPFFQAGILFLF